MKETYFKYVGYFYKALGYIGINQGQDKILHAVVGYMIVFLLMFVTTPIIAIAVGMAAGPLKETADWLVSGRDNAKFDFFDMFATMVGAFAGGLSYNLILWLSIPIF